MKKLAEQYRGEIEGFKNFFKLIILPQLMVIAVGGMIELL